MLIKIELTLDTNHKDTAKILKAIGMVKDGNVLSGPVESYSVSNEEWLMCAGNNDN